MTIAKGRPWGEPAVLGNDGILVHSDAEGSRVLGEARAEGHPLPPLGLVGGDLCATLGGTGSEAHLHSAEARRYPVDLGVARLDGIEHVFLAHVIARRRFWRGRVVAVMNAQWLGTWDLGPKSHPNDGLLDVSDATLPFFERLAARRRLPTGTHVPHPLITVRRTRAWECDFDTPTPILIDGVPSGRARHLEVEAVADAVTVVI